MIQEIHVWLGLTPPVYMNLGVLVAIGNTASTTIEAANDSDG